MIKNQHFSSFTGRTLWWGISGTSALTLLATSYAREWVILPDLLRTTLLILGFLSWQLALASTIGHAVRYFSNQARDSDCPRNSNVGGGK